MPTSREPSTYRRHHRVPRAVLWALTPLFHYSYWRDAWILRGVGETHGPVLGLRGAKAKPRDPPPDRPARRRWVGGLGEVLLLVVIAEILVAATLGVVSAVSTGRPARPLDRASTGSLRVSFPSDWQRGTSPTSSALGVTNALVLRPAAPAGAALIIGRSATDTAGSLPPPLLASLPARPTPQIVALGARRFYRYLELTPRGLHGTESVYELPTTAGPVIAACIAPPRAPAFIARCERLLATVSVPRTQLVSLAPSASYSSGLLATMRRLNAARASAGASLRSARTSHAQAAAASALADAYDRAATAVATIPAGPAAADSAAVVRAMQSAGQAYRGLATDYAGANRTAVVSAGASVLRATEALRSALVSLRSVGAPVS